jgi:hypothetical protein
MALEVKLASQAVGLKLVDPPRAGKFQLGRDSGY